MSDTEEDSNSENVGSITEISDEIIHGEDCGRIERIMRALELTEGVQIARRYLAMNAFDGALTMLGLLLGGLIMLYQETPSTVFNSTLLGAIGTSLAMAISGFSGSYLTESAERDREVEEMGRAMLCDMSESMYARATKTTSAIVAFVDGASPAIAAFIVIIPLLFVRFGVFNYFSSFYAAIVVCMILLFILGLFLGKVSKKSIWKYGAKTFLAGIITALLMYLISIYTGASP